MTTSIHITALNDIINVNSLFTIVVFLGLSWNPKDPNTDLITDPATSTACTPGPQVAKDLVAFHVYSFSSFFFSSLIALALKQAIRISWSPNYHQIDILARVNKNVFRVGMLVSGVGLVCGYVCLIIALINVIQIKLETLACGSGYTIAAFVPLVILVPIVLLIYVSVVLYAFTR